MPNPRDPRFNTSASDHADLLLRAGKKLQNTVNNKADAYLAGTYDPGKDARKHIVRGTTTALVVLSLLTGLAFSSPAEITEDQAAANYRPAPIVMDVDDFVNAPVDDEEDDADEQKGGRVSLFQRFRQTVLSMPYSVRLLIAAPLWLIGTGLMTLISFLWNIIFASPLGAFIASLAAGFAVLLGLFTATAKILFPDVPLRRILSGRNLIILGVTSLLLSCIDAAAPMYWHQYPLAAALIKLVFGGTVIGILSVRTRNLFYRLTHNGLPSV